MSFAFSIGCPAKISERRSFLVRFLHISSNSSEFLGQILLFDLKEYDSSMLNELISSSKSIE